MKNAMDQNHYKVPKCSNELVVNDFKTKYNPNILILLNLILFFI